MSEQLLCVTNFDGDERLRVKQMIHAIGAKYTGYMTHGNSAIICGRYAHVKILHFIVFDSLNLFSISLIFYPCKFLVNIFKFLSFTDLMEPNMTKPVNGKFLW